MVMSGPCVNRGNVVGVGVGGLFTLGTDVLYMGSWLYQGGMRTGFHIVVSCWAVHGLFTQFDVDLLSSSSV